MKITRKDYLEKYSERSSMVRAKIESEKTEDFETYFKLKAQIEKIDKEYFALVPKVNISYSIGSRSYYEEVVKIGKSYFNHGESLTGGRGYWGVKEIPQISEEMTQSMISDSYYY